MLQLIIPHFFTVPTWILLSMKLQMQSITNYLFVYLLVTMQAKLVLEPLMYLIFKT